MSYYGVSSKESIAMRKAGVPRSMAQPLGDRLKTAFGPEIQRKTNTEVLEWLSGLEKREWDQANPRLGVISGEDYKKVWKKFVGI